MAIYFPKLFCEVGQRLKLKKEIIFNSGKSLSVGDICIVVNLIGYGFDIVSEKEMIEFRILNSKMPEFFNKYGKQPKESARKLIARQVAAIVSPKGSVTKIVVMEEENENSKKILYDVLMFTKDFTIKDILTIRHGERFYFEEVKGYYDLYDVKDGWRLLRMKEKEVEEFCQLQPSPVEVEEPVY